MRRTGKVYRKMIFTYIMVLLVPIVCSIAFYKYTYDTVRERSIYYNRNLLETIKSSCDRELMYYNSVLQQLRVDDLVKLYIGDNKLSIPEQKWNIVKVQEILRTLMHSMRDGEEYCEDIFIYQKESNEILTFRTKLDYDSYIDIFRTLEDTEKEAVQQILQNHTQNGIYAVNDGEHAYLLLLNNLYDNTRSGDAIAGMWIKADVLETRIPSIEWNSGTEWALLDNKGNYLYLTELLKSHLGEMPEKGLQDNGYAEIDNQEYIVHKVASKGCDGEYLLFSSVELIEKTADSIKNVFVFCIIVILILGVWATRVSMKITYTPLKKLMDTFSKKNIEDEEKDEYKYLENQVNVLIQKYDTTQETLKKNRMAVRQYAVEKLLIPSEVKIADTPYVYELYEKFKKGVNAVLLFSVHEALDKEYHNDMDIKLCRYVVANVLAEGVGEQFTQETFEFCDKVVMIINTSESSINHEEKLRSLCNFYCEYVENHFKFKVSTYVGNFHKDLKGIHESYLEACLVENFCEDKEEMYLCYNEIDDNNTRKYQYSYEIEDMVINAVRNCNADLAYTLIENVLEKGFFSKEFYLRQCMMYDIYTSLVKASEEMGIEVKKLPYFTQSIADKNLSEIKHWFRDVVDTICKDAEILSQHSDGNEFSEEILKYISGNYTNPDLNISQIAFEFQMTPTYLSTIFKKQTGKSILDVIKQLRLDYAKELIAQNYSVSEVAEMSGFRESSTFIRAFKNSMGVTPGQMKKMK